MSKPIHLSLMEPVALLQDYFRQYAVARLQGYNGQGPVPFKSVEFEQYPQFMEAILAEIFNHQGSFDKVGQISQSAHLLWSAGVDRDTAIMISAEVFKATVDAIVPFLPDMQFGTTTHHYQYGFCDNFDAVITPPRYPEELHEYSTSDSPYYSGT